MILGNVPLFPSDDELDELEQIFDELTDELELNKDYSNMPWREAYEANKIRDICILCGKETQERA